MTREHDMESMKHSRKELLKLVPEEVVDIIVALAIDRRDCLDRMDMNIRTLEYAVKNLVNGRIIDAHKQLEPLAEATRHAQQQMLPSNNWHSRELVKHNKAKRMSPHSSSTLLKATSDPCEVELPLTL